MNGYETTTIGKAFDASFDETKWEAFITRIDKRPLLSDLRESEFL